MVIGKNWAEPSSRIRSIDVMIRKPDFFIVGAPKCGTTAMHHYLRQHPEIFMPERKEPHYFGTDLTAPYFIRDEAKYLALFETSKPAKRAGEASVFYLYSKLAASEIKRFNPAAGIIAMLRNPVDMMYSYHSQRLFSGIEDIEDFEAALAAEPERKEGRRLPEIQIAIHGLYYREMARFTEQLKRYFDEMGREQVHVIIYDDLKSAPARVYAETVRFLKVDESFVPQFEVVNPNKTLRMKSVRKFLLQPPDLIRRISRPLWKPERRERMKRWIARMNSKQQRRVPMSASLRRRLQLEFRPEVENLSRLLNRDLTHWCNEPEIVA